MAARPQHLAALVRQGDGMNQPIYASPRVAYALNKINKTTLMDVVLHLAFHELGDNAEHTEVLKLIQSWVNPILTETGREQCDLVSHALHYDKIRGW